MPTKGGSNARRSVLEPMAKAIAPLTTVFEMTARTTASDAVGMVMLPWARVSGSIPGTPISGSNDGFADPILYVTRSFRGAPALDLEGFMGYQQDTIVAGALIVQMPLGQYDSDRVLNVGTNRWVFKPEVAVSKARGPWTYELYGNVQLFTDNDDYFGDLALEQDAIWGLEGHVIRDFSIVI